jgi:hypothetical protein
MNAVCFEIRGGRNFLPFVTEKGGIYRLNKALLLSVFRANQRLLIYSICTMKKKRKNFFKKTIIN